MAEQQCPTCHEQGMEEGVSDLLITYQTATPNSYRLIKRPITKSCMRSVLEKQIVSRIRKVRGRPSRPSQQIEESFLSCGSKSFRLKFARCCPYGVPTA
jgi:hypothetical protein